MPIATARKTPYLMTKSLVPTRMRVGSGRVVPMPSKILANCGITLTIAKITVTTPKISTTIG